MSEQYNPKCAGVKRLMKEALEFRVPTEMFYAQPLDDNLFEWHFTVRGTLGTDFDGGIYHGRMLFPADYPMKPPNIIILTPNGRFETNKKICLSISGHHPETWLPSWSIRTALLALIGFMPSPGAGAIGSLDYPVSERKKLAKKSLNWKCEECNVLMKDVLKPLSEENSEQSNKDSEEARKLASQVKFEDEAKNEKPEVSLNETPSPDESKIETQPEVSASPPETSEATELIETAPTVTAQPTPSAEIPRIRTQSFRQFPINNQNFQTSSSCDFSLFVIIPLLFFVFSMILVLLSRRLLL